MSVQAKRYESCQYIHRTDEEFKVTYVVNEAACQKIQQDIARIALRHDLVGTFEPGGKAGGKITFHATFSIPPSDGVRVPFPAFAAALEKDGLADSSLRIHLKVSPKLSAGRSI